MLTTEELTMADELLQNVRELRAQIEEARAYAKQRKLATVESGWPGRVEALSAAKALVSDAAAQIERAFA